MKTLLLLLAMTMVNGYLFGQETETPSKVYQNEFGVDATPFIKTILNFDNQTGSSQYSPLYYLTYRRHFAHSNLRIGVSVNFNYQTLPNAYTNDSGTYHNNSYSVNFRVGYEFFNNIGKRWQVFYGIDALYATSYSSNQGQYSNGGYINGDETRNSSYGLAPLLGMRFRISRRISLSTETSLSIINQIGTQKDTFTSQGSQWPPMPSKVFPDTKIISGTFNAPVSVFITFDI